MAGISGPNVVDSGLVIAIDAANSSITNRQ
jgi:hypothetical protein